MLYRGIKDLVNYGVYTGLLPECERIYATNLLLDVFHEDNWEEPEELYFQGDGSLDILSEGNDYGFGSDMGVEVPELELVLKGLLDEAVSRGIIDDNSTARDLFDTRLMNCLTPRPSAVQEAFWSLYAKSPQDATCYFYKLCEDSDYIRRYRIKKDLKWISRSPYGDLDITINLSKPEKDPKAIAAAGAAKSSGYPKCLLCAENEGYAGRMNHPARQNLRVIPLTLCDEPWGFQYSPYVYYNQHCIVFNQKHQPMKISRRTFCRLLDFVRQFPHYFLGSNADLPIVGGSILSHDHFQGGNYTFAMERAPFEEKFSVPGFEDVTAGIVKWPLSVIRIRHAEPERLVDLADLILTKWRAYTDADAFIYAETGGEMHNTITPIARRRGEEYELDLTLRNNITTPEHPLGVYHPHAERHHIKKENIGLIEVMGLAVLPARLKGEMELLADAILNGRDIRSIDSIAKHADWVEEFLPRYSSMDRNKIDAFLPHYGSIDEENIHWILRHEIGRVFTGVLEDAGVFPCTPAGREAFHRFLMRSGLMK